MGDGAIYTCKKCGTTKNIFTGNGMVSFCEEQLFDFNNKYGNIISRCITDRIQNLEELRKFLKLDNMKIMKNFEDEVYICDNCKNITTKFKFTLVADTKRFRPIYNCELCNHKLRPVSKKEEYNIICPKCGDKGLKDISLVNWD